MKDSVVYHTTLRSAKHKILSQGLKTEQENYTILSDNDIVTIDGFYCEPESIQSNTDNFVYSLLLNRLEKYRPSIYPKHHECLFFYPRKSLVGTIQRRPIVFEISGAAFLDTTIYAADLEIIKSYFRDSIQKFEKTKQLEKQAIDTTAKQYWNSVTSVKSIKELSATESVEIFTDENHIPTEYISCISTSGTV